MKTVYLQEYIHPIAQKLLNDKVKVIKNTEEIGTADAIITRNQFKVTEEILEQASQLKIIGVHGTGMDNVAVAAAEKRGITVFNTPGLNSLSVAELNVALSMDLLKNVTRAACDIRNGVSMEQAKSIYKGNEITGKKIGFIGYGAIARQTARILKNGFEADIFAWSRSLTPQRAKQENLHFCANMEEVLRVSDIIFMGMTLTKETERIITLEKLKLCKKTALLVNTARGKLIDEEDLYRALTEHVIAGAACDVFVKEPVSRENTPLTELDNFIPTPHLGGNTEEALYRVGMAVVTGVLYRLGITLTDEELEKYQL